MKRFGFTKDLFAKSDQIEVSAPGKLVLLGEHAVVYQRPCLVSAVSKRLKLEIRKLKGGFLQIEATAVGLKGYRKELHQLCQNELPRGARFVETAVKNFFQKYSFNFGIKVEAKDGFDLKYGLGSSAAVTVSVLKGLTELGKIEVDKRELFDLAYQTVLDVQGVGSGFDVAAAIYGGTIYFKTGGEIIKPIADFELPIVVGYSGTKADTPTLVRQLAEKKEKQPRTIEKIFDEISNLVEKGKKAVLKKDWSGLGKLMVANQKFLEKLGVSTPKLGKMISAAQKAGALGAKLSGAGGGDCMIALVNEKDKADVGKAIKKAGGQVVKLGFSAEGVRLERTLGIDDSSELFVVVGENDNIIGYEPRSICHQNKSLIHRLVGIIIFNKKGQILLQKRSKRKSTHPGFYTLSCSGHVSKGEKYQDTAERELEEELGVKIPLRFFKKFISQSEKETHMSALFKGKSEGPFFPNRKEIERVDFFSKKEIRGLLSLRLLTPFAKRSLQEIGILT